MEENQELLREREREAQKHEEHAETHSRSKQVSFTSISSLFLLYWVSIAKN